MNTPFSRPGARAKILGFALTLATTVLAGAALEAASAQSVVPRYDMTNQNRAISAALAQSYSGRYPLTVTHSHNHNGTGCLTLTDNGTQGWPHSGPVSSAGFLFGGSGTLGDFQLIDKILVATVPQGSGTGGSSSLVFTAAAGNGNLGNGVFEQVYGGLFDSGVLVFGMKGGC